jgi:hypothetical protein
MVNSRRYPNLYFLGDRVNFIRAMDQEREYLKFLRYLGPRMQRSGVSVLVSHGSDYRSTFFEPDQMADGSVRLRSGNRPKGTHWQLNAGDDLGKVMRELPGDLVMHFSCRTYLTPQMLRQTAEVAGKAVLGWDAVIEPNHLDPGKMPRARLGFPAPLNVLDRSGAVVGSASTLALTSAETEAFVSSGGRYLPASALDQLVLDGVAEPLDFGEPDIDLQDPPRLWARRPERPPSRVLPYARAVGTVGARVGLGIGLGIGGSWVAHELGASNTGAAWAGYGTAMAGEIGLEMYGGATLGVAAARGFGWATVAAAGMEVLDAVGLLPTWAGGDGWLVPGWSSDEEWRDATTPETAGYAGAVLNSLMKPIRSTSSLVAGSWELLTWWARGWWQ